MILRKLIKIQLSGANDRIKICQFMIDTARHVHTRHVNIISKAIVAVIFRRT